MFLFIVYILYRRSRSMKTIIKPVQLILALSLTLALIGPAAA